jgi:Cys-tRNA(Pro)/Cys-tRNA(Cys) deacylase
VNLYYAPAVARTPAIAAAEQAGIAFRTHAYDHDSGADSYGREAADKLGLDPRVVFKTLVIDLDGKPAIAILPVSTQLDLRALGKRATLAERTVAERTTGYVLGGISPLGGRKRLPTVLDSSALEHETIHVSAGRRGLEIELAPHDLARLTDAEIRPIAR